MSFLVNKNKSAIRHIIAINPFTVVYICTPYAGGKYGYFDVIMVLHMNIMQNHNQSRDLYQLFSCLFETFGSMSEIMFSSDSMSNKYFFIS